MADSNSATSVLGQYKQNTWGIAQHTIYFAPGAYMGKKQLFNNSNSKFCSMNVLEEIKNVETIIFTHVTINFDIRLAAQGSAPAAGIFEAFLILSHLRFKIHEKDYDAFPMALLAPYAHVYDQTSAYSMTRRLFDTFKLPEPIEVPKPGKFEMYFDVEPNLFQTLATAETYPRLPGVSAEDASITSDKCSWINFTFQGTKERPVS